MRSISWFVIGMVAGVCFFESTTSAWRAGAVSDVKRAVGGAVVWTVSGIRQAARWLGEQTHVGQELSQDQDQQASRAS